VDNGEITEPSECSTFDRSSNLEDLQRMVAEMIAQHRIEGKGLHPQLDIEKLSKSPHFCSFCSKHSSEVKHLIAGSTVYICNECMNICNELLENLKESND
jgi:hypothetical protein